MKKIVLPLALLFLVFSACGPNPELIRLEDEVMRVHDESMLGMSDIRSLKKELRKHLTKPDLTEDPNPALTNEVQTALVQLESADELMMDWMHNYSKPSGGDEAQALAYFKSELVKINAVDSLMNASVDFGMKILDQVKAAE